MEDLEDIRRRMREKKNKKVLTDDMFKRFYRFAITTMSVCVIVLMGSCFIKANPDMDVMALIDEHVLSLLPIPLLNEDQAVSQDFLYQEVEENIFVGNDEYIYALEDGLIQSVDEQCFTVLYQNGITATYDKTATVLVKAYDRIKKGDKIGTYEQQFHLTLIKNGQEVSYDEIFA